MLSLETEGLDKFGSLEMQVNSVKKVFRFYIKQSAIVLFDGTKPNGIFLR